MINAGLKVTFKIQYKNRQTLLSDLNVHLLATSLYGFWYHVFLLVPEIEIQAGHMTRFQTLLHNFIDPAVQVFLYDPNYPSNLIYNRQSRNGRIYLIYRTTKTTI